MNKPMILKTRHIIELFPKAPFNFDATMHKPDHFPSADNEWELGIRWQTMLWEKVPLGLKIENKGTVSKPEIVITCPLII